MQVGKKFRELSFVPNSKLNHSLKAPLMFPTSILGIQRGKGCVGAGMGQETRRPGLRASEQLQVSYADRPPRRSLQLRTWSGQEVRARQRGSFPVTARGLEKSKGRIVTMPSWSLHSDWPEHQQPESLRSKEGGRSLSIASSLFSPPPARCSHSPAYL